MLVVHHLGVSQSERIVWLCEELGLDYVLKRHERDPVTRLAPPALRALHPAGTAPVIEEDGLVLGESGAIMEHILDRHGRGRLRPAPDHPDRPHYLFWFHFANGTLQAQLHRAMLIRRLEPPADNPVLRAAEERRERSLAMVEQRLAGTPWLAGEAFSAADIMALFCFTTMRHFLPYDIAPYPALQTYLRRAGERDGYRRAMAKADPDLVPLLS